MKPTIGFVHPPSIFEYPARIAAASSRTAAIRARRYRPHQGTLPAIDEVDALVVTGSTAHVYDEAPWMRRTTSFLRRALDSGVPVLGVCFGHQLLATALGGTVERLDESAVGYRSIRLESAGTDSRLFDGVPGTFLAFDWHADHVSTLPPDAEILGMSDASIQAFAAQEHPAFGIQFHPEFDVDMITTVFDHEGLPRDDDRRTGIHERVERSSVARQIYDNFFDFVVEQDAHLFEKRRMVSAHEGGQ